MRDYCPKRLSPPNLEKRRSGEAAKLREAQKPKKYIYIYFTTSPAPSPPLLCGGEGGRKGSFMTLSNIFNQLKILPPGQANTSCAPPININVDKDPQFHCSTMNPNSLTH